MKANIAEESTDMEELQTEEERAKLEEVQKMGLRLLCAATTNRHNFYDFGLTDIPQLQNRSELFQNQSSIVFIGQDLIFEYNKRIQGMDHSY